MLPAVFKAVLCIGCVGPELDASFRSPGSVFTTLPLCPVPKYPAWEDVLDRCMSCHLTLGLEERETNRRKRKEGTLEFLFQRLPSYKVVTAVSRHALHLLPGISFSPSLFAHCSLLLFLFPSGLNVYSVPNHYSPMHVTVSCGALPNTFINLLY